MVEGSEQARDFKCHLVTLDRDWNLRNEASLRRNI
jgi:hypothetical protein